MPSNRHSPVTTSADGFEKVKIFYRWDLEFALIDQHSLRSVIDGSEQTV